MLVHVRSTLLFHEPSSSSRGGRRCSQQHNITEKHSSSSASLFEDVTEEALPDHILSRCMIPIMLDALDKIGGTSCGQDMQNQLTYNFLELMRETLDQICSLAAASGKHQYKPKEAALKKRRTQWRKRPSSPQPAPTREKNIMRLSSFLVDTLKSLQRRRKIDSAIEESFLHFLLSRVGKVLKTFVFGVNNEHWNNLRDHNADVNSANARDTVGGGHSPKEELAILESQAPYLIWILERTMACVTRHGRESTTNPSASQIISSSKVDVRQGTLSERLKSKLQNTMLHALFGADVPGFNDLLEAPVNPNVRLDPWTPTTPTDIADKFKAEVWRVVGWDVLRGHLEM